MLAFTEGAQQDFAVGDILGSIVSPSLTPYHWMGSTALECLRAPVCDNLTIHFAHLVWQQSPFTRAAAEIMVFS